MRNGRLFLKSLTSLVLFSSCSVLNQKPPKLDKCLVTIRYTDEAKTRWNPQESKMICVNPYGTTYELPLAKADKYICGHPKQIFEAAAYIKVVLDKLQSDYLQGK